MSVDLDRSVTCAIGEYLVLAELLKRGLEAFIAHGPTQRGWDIAVVRRTGELERTVRVQVKTIDWPTANRRTVTISTELKFDYLVVVLLDLEMPHSRYLILTKSEIDAVASLENPDRTNAARSWYISPAFMAADPVGVHEGKWDKIVGANTSPPGPSEVGGL